MGAWAQAQSKQVLPRSDRALILIGLLACLPAGAGGRWATLRQRGGHCGVTDVMAHQEFFFHCPHLITD
jgi:hypothetical protein